MSKKHFESAARYIKSLVEQGMLSEAIRCYSLIVLINDNGLFNESRFHTACGLDREGNK